MGRHLIFIDASAIVAMSVGFPIWVTDHPIPVLGPCDIGAIRPNTVQRPACLELRCKISLYLIAPIVREARNFGGRRVRLSDPVHEHELML